MRGARGVAGKDEGAGPNSRTGQQGEGSDQGDATPVSVGDQKDLRRLQASDRMKVLEQLVPGFGMIIETTYDRARPGHYYRSYGQPIDPRDPDVLWLRATAGVRPTLVGEFYQSVTIKGRG